MKKIALSFAALGLTAGAAFAADLPSKKGPPALPPPPAPPLWTGFYVGLNAGGTWANSNGQYIGVGPTAADADWGGNPTLAAFAAAASASTGGGNSGGFLGGGQIGYNWQFYTNFVAGIEADIQGVAGSGGASGSTIVAYPAAVGTSNFVGITSARGSLQYLGTVRGRLGWLFTPTLLVYGTGGLAYGGVSLNTATSVANDQSLFSTALGGVNFSDTQVGWTAGGGLEWMFIPNWSAKVEYLYYDLGTVRQNFALVSTAANNLNATFGGEARARISGNIVRAGVNYHFNWGAPAPILAKF